jgi:pre-mRNA branch site protein p14
MMTPSGGGVPLASEQIPLARRGRLPPEVSRILYVRNLPYKLSRDDMYDIFGKYGSIRQVRQGHTPETRGRAFVVYDDIYDAKAALEHLNGFNVMGRYLVVLYYQAEKSQKRMDIEKAKQENDALRRKLEEAKKADSQA